MKMDKPNPHINGWRKHKDSTYSQSLPAIDASVKRLLGSTLATAIFHQIIENE